MCIKIVDVNSITKYYRFQYLEDGKPYRRAHDGMVVIKDQKRVVVFYPNGTVTIFDKPSHLDGEFVPVEIEIKVIHK